MDNPIMTWDECDIAEAAFEADRAMKDFDDLSDEQLRQQVYGDSWLFQDEWNSLTDYLTEIMKEVNSGSWWLATVKSFGWQGRDGYKEPFQATTGEELLRAILPKTDCTFKIFREGNILKIQNFHHDSPTGNEWYTIGEFIEEDDADENAGIEPDENNDNGYGWDD